MRKKYLQKSICFLFPLFFCACSYTYKDAPLYEQLNYTSEVTQAYVADKEWWKAYNNTELNQLVSLALQNNTDLAKSALNIQRAMYQARLSGLNLFPTLGGTTAASTNKDLKNGSNWHNSFSGELNLNYELDLWGKIHDAADAAKWEHQATIYDLENIRLALINSIVDVYYNLTYLHNATQITQENLHNYKNIEEIIRLKFTSGKIDELELLQIRQTIINTENTLATYRLQIQENERVLRELLNVKPDYTLSIQYPNMLTIHALGVNLNIPLAVLAERPDLKASEARLQKAFKSLRASSKNWYPSVSLRALVASSADQIANALDFPFAFGSVSINLPFLDWNRVYTNIKISETEYETARLDFQFTINTALNEVAYYYYAYENAQGQLANLNAKYATDLQIVSLYQLRYSSGKIEFRSLLDSIIAKNISQISLLNNNYQLIKYENMVYKAMAGRYTFVK